MKTTTRKKRDAYREIHGEGPSKLEKWVREHGGISTIAKILDVYPSTVMSWVKRKNTPSLQYAAHMVSLSRGKLSYNDILESTLEW